MYQAPRMPHALNWAPILKSAEDLKFGHIKGSRMPGMAKALKAAAAKKLAETIEPTPPRVKRPSVPRFKHPPPKPTEDEKSQAETDKADKSSDRKDPDMSLKTGMAEAPLKDSTNGAGPPPGSMFHEPRRKAPTEAKDEKGEDVAEQSQKPRQRGKHHQRQQTSRSHSQEQRNKRASAQKCTWCGAQDVPGHSRVCKLRPAECVFCGQQLAYAAQAQHERMCAKRPASQQEIRAYEGRRSKTPGSRSGSSMSHRGQDVGTTTPLILEDNNVLALQVLSNLRNEAEKLQLRLDTVTKDAMLQDAMKAGNQDGQSNAEVRSSIEEFESTLKALGQQLAVVELSNAGGASSLDAQLQESPSQHLLPSGDSESDVDALIDLQQRLGTFRVMLRTASEHAAAASRAPQQPAAPLGAERKAPPPNAEKEASSLIRRPQALSSVETPRRQNRAGQQLAPLSTRPGSGADSHQESRGGVAPNVAFSGGSRSGSLQYQQASTESVASLASEGGRRGRASSASTSRNRSTSQTRSAPLQPIRQSRQQKKQQQQEPSAPIGPGPAAMGYQEATIEQLRAEIDQERRQYIARRKKELEKDELNQRQLLERSREKSRLRAAQRSSSPHRGRSSSAGGRGRPTSVGSARSVASSVVPSLSDMREQNEQERLAFITRW
eukprot:TRINITY_DN79667_c0_g1_i1.p1 TRINITY_DN79667_c0_g1~~TRINITY_DN79667_c0_g1_i1.p1  ORF type:complete len:762 (+),score=181.10 TRINITY_DN79667_c0_g1_i1:298-2286(+)